MRGGADSRSGTELLQTGFGHAQRSVDHQCGPSALGAEDRRLSNRKVLGTAAARMAAIPSQLLRTGHSPIGQFDLLQGECDRTNTKMH